MTALAWGRHYVMVRPDHFRVELSARTAAYFGYHFGPGQAFPVGSV